MIPFLVMVPDGGTTHPALIYLHPESKASEAAPGEAMEWFVKQGYLVLAPDLIGRGEMGPGDFKGDAYNFKLGKASYNIWFASIQVGRSIVGIHASDVMRLVKYLKRRDDIEAGKIGAVARGEMCSALLHAAAFESSISKIALIEPLISYHSIVMNRYYKPALILTTVAGSLKKYDLPDLAACIAPRELLMLNVADQNGKRADEELIEKNLSVVRFAYSAAGASEKLEIRGWEPHQNMDELFSFWLR